MLGEFRPSLTELIGLRVVMLGEKTLKWSTTHQYRNAHEWFLMPRKWFLDLVTKIFLDARFFSCNKKLFPTTRKQFLVPKKSCGKNRIALSLYKEKNMIGIRNFMWVIVKYFTSTNIPTIVTLSSWSVYNPSVSSQVPAPLPPQALGTPKSSLESQERRST